MFLLRDDINEIGCLVNEGKTICFPTDTVWAIGCDATNDEAVKAVRTIKGTPDTQGLVVLVGSIEHLKQYVVDLPPRIETLLALHQRPFTLIYHEVQGLSGLVGASDGSVAIRVTYDPFCTQLIGLTGKPLVASIAAPHDQAAPANFGGISSAILGSVDYVVKHRQDDKSTGVPSPLARLDQFQELDFIRE
jgi:L-threonylcarbamoyladenylate synthase